MAVIVREKQVMKDILLKYKELPCLWDQSHELYSNKVARKQANEILLEKYRLCDPDATLHEFKKKLENMRTTYRRERVKVLKSRISGGDIYVPTLWYYDLYTFLDDAVDDSMSSQRQLSVYVEGEEMEEENGEDILDEEFLKGELDHTNTPSPPPKKKRKSNVIFLAEDEHDQSEPYTIENTSQNNLESTSTELFGRTIGLQLNELDSMQRFIAEKLISDVIFYARLDKLEPTTKLNLNNNDDDY